MKPRVLPLRSALIAFLCANGWLAICGPASAEPSPQVAIAERITGAWLVNDKLSDDSDRQVERAVREAGGRMARTGKRGKGRYRGGPQEHELYDRMSYDESLAVRVDGPEVRITYDDGFERVFHTDGRSRVVTASGSASGDRADFSFGAWDGESLRVESRVRDGGWTWETYTLQEDGRQLRVELRVKPLSFGVPISITRIYDRQQQAIE
jgi:hypothetical protein